MKRGASESEWVPPAGAVVAVMPDSFGGTLTAAEAAAAIAGGWHRGRPGDEVVCAPQSDGGPGFIDVLAASGVGTRRSLTVPGPLGVAVEAPWLWEAQGRVAYVESAAACGLSLLGREPDPATAAAATTAGVGALVAAALEAGAVRIVVGLGGSATTDGGRGLVDALDGFPAARERCRGIELIAATDVDSPLCGASGAAAVFGPQKGADAATVRLLEARLVDWAAELGRTETAGRAGAGAAGGLGFALLALGGRRVAGADVVADVTGRRELVARCDLVLTGEGRLDTQTPHGKVVAAVCREAGAAGVPVVAVAGQVELDGAALRRLGVRRAYSLTEFAGSPDQARARAAPLLNELAAAIASETSRYRE